MTEDCNFIVRMCGNTMGFSTNVVNIRNSISISAIFQFQLKNFNKHKCDIHDFMQAKLTILRNGNRFYRGRMDICDMLDNHPQTFAQIKLNGEKFVCPIKPVSLCDWLCTS